MGVVWRGSASGVMRQKRDATMPLFTRRNTLRRVPRPPGVRWKGDKTELAQNPLFGPPHSLKNGKKLLHPSGST